MQNPQNNKPPYSRRRFIRQSAVLGSAALITRNTQLFASNKTVTKMKNVATKGYAARDASALLSPWSFERRAVGNDDVLIDIKFCGICHSDIHQMRGEWGQQQYPQVPGHEIAGIVAAIGKNVTKFRVGDKVGVGCMVDSCMTCTSCKNGEEHHCDNNATIFTYGTPDKTSPSGITQGGYSNNVVVKEHFVIRIPDSIPLQEAAPLLCAGITTYSPLTRSGFQKGDKVGVAGIGGLGHLAIKLAAAKGAEVYAFTTSESKRKDILAFGAKEVIVVKDAETLKPYFGKLDYMISTIPYAFDISSYFSCVKPYGSFTQVGQPINGEFTFNNGNLMTSRVNLNSSLIGGIPETQEVMNHCAENKIYPEIKIVSAKDINEIWKKVVSKEARYRYVIDAATI